MNALLWRQSAIVTVLAMALGGCGGGNGGVAGMPAPQAAPPAISGATDKIIGGATLSQTFAAFDYAPNADGGVTIRFDAPSGTYSVTTPADTTPAPLQRSSNYAPLAGEPWMMFIGPHSFRFDIRASANSVFPETKYSYSNLAGWGFAEPASLSGTTAFGAQTPSASVPRTGSGNYVGFLEGSTSETCACGWDGETVAGGLSGTVKLAFDFAGGKFSGTINPKLILSENHDLGQLQISNPQWSVGSPTFAAQLSGKGIVNSSVDGAFTGPAAQELIGALDFGYTSPVGGGAQTAGGAFIAKQ